MVIVRNKFFFSKHGIKKIVNSNTKDGNEILDNIQDMYQNPYVNYLLIEAGKDHPLRTIKSLNELIQIEIKEEIFNDALEELACRNSEGDWIEPRSANVITSYDVQNDSYSKKYAALSEGGEKLEVVSELVEPEVDLDSEDPIENWIRGCGRNITDWGPRGIWATYFIEKLSIEEFISIFKITCTDDECLDDFAGYLEDYYYEIIENQVLQDGFERFKNYFLKYCSFADTEITEEEFNKAMESVKELNIPTLEEFEKKYF